VLLKWHRNPAMVPRKKGKAPEQDSSAGSPLNGAPKRAK